MFNNFLSTPLPPYHNGLVKMLEGKYKNMFLAPHIHTACTVLNVNAMAEANTIAWVRGPRPKQNIYSLYRHLTTLNSTIQHSFSLDILRFRHIVSPRKLQIKDDIKRREYLNRSSHLSHNIHSRIRALVIIRENCQQNCTFLCFIQSNVCAKTSTKVKLGSKNVSSKLPMSIYQIGS